MSALGEASVVTEAEVTPATPGGLRKESAWRRRDRRWGYVFVGPQLLGMALFVVVPFVASLVLAFAHWDGLNALSWVGFDNFQTEMTDPLFGRAILNTLLIALITVPVGLGLAVVLAVALERLKTRTLYLILFFAPVVTSSVAVAMIWQQLFRKDGVLSGFIASVFHIAPPDWLGDPHLALIAVCIVTIWSSVGLNVIIFLAGLQNISPTVIEAARLDGAGEIRIFTTVVMPLGGPAIASLGIFQFLWVWNDMLVALIFANSDAAPITVALQEQVRQFGNNIDVLSSGAFVSMIVPLVVFFVFQRQFVGGVMAGAIK